MSIYTLIDGTSRIHPQLLLLEARVVAEGQEMSRRVSLMFRSLRM